MDSELQGELVALGTGTGMLGGEAVVWVSARMDNPTGRLRPGMTGEVWIAPTTPGAWGVWDAVLEVLDGP